MLDTATKITKKDIESIDLIEPNLAKDAVSGYQRVPLDLHEFERNMIADVKERFSLKSNRETLRVMIHYFHSHMEDEPYIDDEQIALFDVESKHDEDNDYEHNRDDHGVHDMQNHEHHDEQNHDEQNHDEQNHEHHDEWHHDEQNRDRHGDQYHEHHHDEHHDNWNGGW